MRLILAWLLILCSMAVAHATGNIKSTPARYSFDEGCSQAFVQGKFFSTCASTNYTKVTFLGFEECSVALSHHVSLFQSSFNPDGIDCVRTAGSLFEALFGKQDVSVQVFDLRKVAFTEIDRTTLNYWMNGMTVILVDEKDTGDGKGLCARGQRCDVMSMKYDKGLSEAPVSPMDILDFVHLLYGAP